MRRSIGLIVVWCVAVMTTVMSSGAQRAGAILEPPLAVTVQLTPAQHAAIVWAIANPRRADDRPVSGPQPATVEAYLERLIRVALRPVERLKLDDDAKVAEKSRKTLEQRLTKLTTAQCLRLASELAVTTDKLPCGAKGNR